MAADDLTQMRMAPGMAMNIEVLGGDGKRHKCVFLGMIAGRSVMMSTPLVGEGRPLLLRKDQGVVCRFFDQKGCLRIPQSVAAHLYHAHSLPASDLAWPC